MYKNILFWLLALETAIRFLCLAGILVTGGAQFSIFLWISTGCLLFAGIVLFVRHFVLKGSRLFQLLLYHGAEALIVCINLFSMKNYPLELTIFQIGFIGTFANVIFSAVLLLLAFQEKRVQLRREIYRKPHKKADWNI